MPGIAKLTSKQEGFCQSIVKGASLSDAYRENYNIGKMKGDSINRLAHGVMENVKVASRVEELRQPAVDKLLLSHEDHIRTLKKLRDEAAEFGQYGAAIKAEENCGKVAGLYVQKVEMHGEVKMTGVLRIGGTGISMEDWLKATGGTSKTEE